MHKNFRLATAGAVIAAAMSLTTAANAATATGNATAEVLSALQLTEDNGLDFGQAAVNGAGTIVVSADGTSDACTGGVVCAGLKVPATFTATGAPNIGLAATLPASATLNRVGGGASMTADNFTVYWIGGSGLDATGTRSLQVGATLNVANGQLTGVYNGTYTMTVNYN